MRTFFYPVRWKGDLVAVAKIIFDREPDDGDCYTWCGGYDFIRTVRIHVYHWGCAPRPANWKVEDPDLHIDSIAIKESEAISWEALGMCPILEIRE